MSQTAPTKKQKQILDFIEDYYYRNGVSPTYREIAAGVGSSSPATIAQHIDNCIALGYLKKSPHSARSLFVIYGKDERLLTLAEVVSEKIDELNRAAARDLENEALSDKEKIKTREYVAGQIETLKQAATILGVAL